MSDFQRGIVKTISFEIEYPDGSTKQSEIADAGDVRAIVFHEDHLQSPDDAALFCVSASDWRENPSMIVYPSHGGPFTACVNVGRANVCEMRR